MHYFRAVLPRVRKAILKHPMVAIRRLSERTSHVSLNSTSEISSNQTVSKEPKDEKKLYKILTIDGGGIRGIIPATVLMEIEEKTGKPISELFDYIAGTSTGGLLALGLNLPHPSNPQKPVKSASDLLELYEERGEDIFNSSLETTRFAIVATAGWLLIMTSILTLAFNDKDSVNSDDNESVLEGDPDEIVAYDILEFGGVAVPGRPITRREFEMDLKREAYNRVMIRDFLVSKYAFGLISLILLSKYLMTKYNHMQLEKILKLYFNDTPLKDSIKEVLVTTYDVQKHTSKFLTKSSALKNPDDNFLMREAVRATSAAPTFFKPYIRGESKYIDGGIYANNPTMCAFADAQKHAKGKELFVVSIGTGVHKPKELGNFESYGIIQWVLKGRLGRAMMEGSSTAVHTQMETMMEVMSSKENYSRIQVQTTSDISLDAVDSHNIKQLKEYGKKCVEENREEIERVCRRLQ